MNINFKNTFIAAVAIFLLSFIPPDKKRKFIDPANMDMSVKPGDNTNRLHQLMEDEARSSAPDKFRQVGNYYLSGMDSVTIEKSGYKPLLPHLERINKLKTVDDILNEMAYERVNGILRRGRSSLPGFL
jgi:putative endopeptidase